MNKSVEAAAAILLLGLGTLVLIGWLYQQDLEPLAGTQEHPVKKDAISASARMPGCLHCDFGRLTADPARPCHDCNDLSHYFDCDATERER